MQHLSREKIDAAASLFLAARQATRIIEELPIDLQPRSLADAYAIQTRVVELSGEAVGGWSLGATSAESRRQLSLAAPYTGRLLANALHESPATLAAPRRLQPVLEVEFAFRLERDLPARAAPYHAEEVAAAVASVHPAIVLASSHLKDWTSRPALDLIADNGTDAALVYGTGVHDWHNLGLAGLEVHLSVNARRVRSGLGENAMGGPLTALTWLANHRSQAGDGLRAGQMLDTGSVTGMYFPHPGDVAVADFGPLGTVTLNLTG